eukprot:3710393-Amphidinium_carterae.3
MTWLLLPSPTTVTASLQHEILVQPSHEEARKWYIYGTCALPLNCVEPATVSSWAEWWTIVRRAAENALRLRSLQTEPNSNSLTQHVLGSDVVLFCEQQDEEMDDASALFPTEVSRSTEVDDEAKISTEVGDEAKISAASFPTEVDDDAEMHPEENDEAQTPGDETQPDRLEHQNPQTSPDLLSSGEKELLLKLHVNLGHPTRERLAQALRAAGARPEAIRYVREELECASCRSGARQHLRRKAALPRTFQFNKLIGMDTFGVRVYTRSGTNDVAQEYHVLNIVCHGSSYQACAVLPRLSAAEVKKAFLTCWIRPFGGPEAVLSDAGPEFHAEFEHLLERLNILHLHTDPASPWQAGKVERHGGWLKEMLEAELSRGQASIIHTAQDLDELISELVGTKNRHLNRGGYSPTQLVFGRNPVIPHELLDQQTVCRPEDHPIYPQDSPAEAEFDRAAAVRRRARELAFAHQAKSKLAMASSTRRHHDVQYRPGQWVYVWRQQTHPPSTQVRHRKGVWRGPGLVVLHSGHTVWVSMRSRLWRCNVDQLRNAASEEMLGAELVQQGQLKDLLLHLHSTRGGSAVDVASEGPPPTSDESMETVEEHSSSVGMPLQPASASQLTPVEIVPVSAQGPSIGVPLPSDPTHSEPEPHLSSGGRSPVEPLTPREVEDRGAEPQAKVPRMHSEPVRLGLKCQYRSLPRVAFRSPSRRRGPLESDLAVRDHRRPRRNRG